MKDYFFNKRFNIIEASIIAAMAIALSRSEWLLFGVIAVVGVLVHSILSIWLKGRKTLAKDRQWQYLADCGQKVAAIKEHRTLYGSSLKEALVAVDTYLNADSRYNTRRRE